MKSGLSDITVILDRSGSMQTIRDDMVGALNAFVEDQKKHDGECKFTLIQFDDLYDVVYDAVPLREVGECKLEPRGWTALLDAIGRAVTEAGIRFSNLDDSERPDRVLFVIITDGQENASKEYARERIVEMVKHQTEAYKWEFIYLGANQDAIAVGASLGVARGKSLDYGANASGVRKSNAILSAKAAAYRTSGAFEDFTAEERSEAIN